MYRPNLGEMILFRSTEPIEVEGEEEDDDDE